MKKIFLAATAATAFTAGSVMAAGFDELRPWGFQTPSQKFILIQKEVLRQHKKNGFLDGPVAAKNFYVRHMSVDSVDGDLSYYSQSSSSTNIANQSIANQQYVDGHNNTLNTGDTTQTSTQDNSGDQTAKNYSKSKQEYVNYEGGSVE